MCDYQKHVPLVRLEDMQIAYGRILFLMKIFTIITSASFSFYCMKVGGALEAQLELACRPH